MDKPKKYHGLSSTKEIRGWPPNDISNDDSAKVSSLGEREQTRTIEEEENFSTCIIGTRNTRSQTRFHLLTNVDL